MRGRRPSLADGRALLDTSIGLVLGLTTPGAFGSDYSGRSVAATFASSSTAVTELTSKGADRHKLYLIGAASGASADAGGATLTIVVTR